MQTNYNHLHDYSDDPAPVSLPTTIGECYEIIEQEFEKAPKDKRTKQYTIWKEGLSDLIDHCHHITGEKRYNKPT
jgi:hypothetical protein